jgi:hypothetical protein
MEKLLAALFPPKLTPLNPVEDLRDTLGYHERINRGQDNNPLMVGGVEIVRVTEWNGPITDVKEFA